MLVMTSIIPPSIHQLLLYHFATTNHLFIYEQHLSFIRLLSSHRHRGDSISVINGKWSRINYTLQQQKLISYDKIRLKLRYQSRNVPNKDRQRQCLYFFCVHKKYSFYKQGGYTSSNLEPQFILTNKKLQEITVRCYQIIF